jgi:hypothetical protein
VETARRVRSRDVGLECDGIAIVVVADAAPAAPDAAALDHDVRALGSGDARKYFFRLRK